MLRKALQAYGYEVVAIPMKGVLHLKSVCTALDDHTVLVNPRHFDTAEFSEYGLIEVPADESMVANDLRINGPVCVQFSADRRCECSLRARSRTACAAPEWERLCWRRQRIWQ